ncbi:hypothetical protein BLNAU_17769 [Blattamonas nauphoetae]|uniref:Uncharacterized protein n=1 Tax=Blattamonas nauphoetae TaxID=2049346 RepID=A0ABQ9X6R1_9EUKA|nr:hypothetical protein BLNAU_17769 [Blattamonas nauphoetae]
MPPKHRLGRKQKKTQPTPHQKHVQSSKLNKPIVHSTIQESIDVNGDSSRDSDLIQASTDAFTISASDRQYILISKRILQYELKRKRLNVRTMSEQTHLGDGEISLLTTVMSDWRLVLQDSITRKDLRQGCLSLFDQVNSGLKLDQIEVNHAIRFLNYAVTHIEHRILFFDELLEIILWNTKDDLTKLMSSLINLLSLSSDPLRTAVLSFFVVSLRISTKDFRIEVAPTGLLAKLFLVLKPHEIPLNDTTIEFHRHLTSIVDHFFFFVPTATIINHLGDQARAADIIEPTFRSICSYLQFLMDTPVSLPDHRSGFTFLLNMRLFSPFNINCLYHSSSPALRQCFGGIQEKMVNELDSLFGTASTRLVTRLLHSARNVENLVKFGRSEESDIPSWVMAFESLLGRVSEGKKISDFAVNAVKDFMSECPKAVKLYFWTDGTFCLTKNNIIPHHAATSLTTFTVFVRRLVSVVYRHFVWKRWFPSFINAVDPSKLPFTSDFTTLHTTLITLLDDHFSTIRDYEGKMTQTNELTDEIRSKLDELYLAFYKQTKDSIVRLSLHPFALDDDDDDTILDFLDRLFGSDCTHSKTRSFREEIRTEMDASELSSSPPPFILTSELVFELTDDEIINIVDRIVALLTSDSPLDDDTILRICVFCKRSFDGEYLPELFRKAGRSTEQYFHTLESLLSLHLNCSPQTPIDNLLSTRPTRHQPTFDEWDDVDLEKGLVLMRVLNLNALSLTSDSPQPNQLLLKYAIHCLPQMRNCSARNQLPQLERLISPSIDILCTYFIRPPPCSFNKAKEREIVFVDILKLCDERVIARCVSRTGFFSRLVADLLNHTFDASESLFCVIVEDRWDNLIRLDDMKTIRKTVPHFLEEGWQDALETVFVKKGFNSSYNNFRTRQMMQFFGTNLVEVEWD